MSPDIPTSSAVDLVIFTVVDAKSLSERLWDDSLVSQGQYSTKSSSGLSLFVVTIPADQEKYPNLARSRVLLPRRNLG